MLSVIQKFYLGVCTLLLSTYSVFACINDAYTSRSETLWGSYYSNAFEINLITTVLIILFESYFIIRLFRLHNKNQTVKTEKFFTLFMLFISGFFISGMILSGGLLELLFGILLLFFFAYYTCIFIYQIYLLVRKNIGVINLRETIFLGILVLYLIVICYMLFGGFSSHGINGIILITTTLMMLFYVLFIIKSYRYRISTIIIITLLMIQGIPLYMKYYEFSSIKPPQNQQLDGISWGSAR